MIDTYQYPMAATVPLFFAKVTPAFYEVSLHLSFSFLQYSTQIDEILSKNMKLLYLELQKSYNSENGSTWNLVQLLNSIVSIVYDTTVIN